MGNHGPHKKNFLWIKQGLDPKYSYIIFEHDLAHQGESLFDPANGIYMFLKDRDLTWQQVVDMDLAMEYLVIRVFPGKEDKVLGKILGYGFSDNIVFYIFKAEEV